METSPSMNELLSKLKYLVSSQTDDKYAVAELNKRIEVLDKEISEVEKQILQYNGNGKGITQALGKVLYNSNWGPDRKAVYFYKQTRKCLSNREVVNAILEKEERINDVAYSDLLASKLADTLARRVNDQKVLNRYKENNVFYYGLPEWFDANNEPLEEFKMER